MNATPPPSSPSIADQHATRTRSRRQRSLIAVGLCSGMLCYLGLFGGLEQGARSLGHATPVGKVATEARSAPRGALGIYVRGSRSLTPGTLAALRVATHEATSETESAPLPGVEISVQLSSSAAGGRSAQLFRGITDAVGALDTRYQVPDWPAGKYRLEVRGHIADQKSVQTQEVILEAGARILVQSDKPLYQPGQEVHLRALVMRAQDGRPLGSGRVRFTVEDPRKNRIMAAERPLSAFGIASTDLPLAEELLLGAYHIRAELVGVDKAAAMPAEPVNLDIEVARYVLPKLQVSVSSDRSYYAPGEPVALSVSGRYFQGKPVAGGRVTVIAQLLSDRETRSLATLHGKLDASGKLTLTLPLPKLADADAAGPSDERQLLLDTRVEDEAAQRADTRSEILVARDPLRVDVVAEAGSLVPGVGNRVMVLAARPDGSPVAGATASLTLASDPGRVLSARTDAIGIATIDVPPALLKSAAGAKNADCGNTKLAVEAAVETAGRKPLREKRCIELRASGGLLLRTDRAVYGRGERIGISLSVPEVTSGLAYVDVIRDKQAQDTLVIPLHGGAGRIELPPDERRAGTLSLLGYVLLPDGTQRRDGRLVYVERPSALRVTAQAEPESGERDRALKPGEAARLRLRVVDAESGAGVPAAVGLLMVDEALLALRPLRPGLLRAYFSLSEAARTAAKALRVQPGGVAIDALVERGGLSALEQEAATLLLAGAQPPWQASWEVDPWEQRKQSAEQQLKRWSTAVGKYAEGHSLGERVPGTPAGWRYRKELPALMRAAGSLAAVDLLDPWRRPVTTQRLIEAAALPEFAEYAQQGLDEKLTQIYKILWRRLQGELRSGARPKDADGAVPLTEADLADPSLASLVDPWGGRFRLVALKRIYKVGPLRSRAVIASAGPDGIPGNKDDRYATDNICHVRSCPARDGEIEVAGVSWADAFSENQPLCGCGYGAGGGALFGAHHVSVPMVRAGAVHSMGFAERQDHVRSNFPETLLHRPEILTDEKGEATVPLTMADSITTWRLLAEAVAQDGRLGSFMAGVPVLQDFFIDLDLPPVVTQSDELAVPVPVYNHQKVAQRVALTLQQDVWFTPLGPTTESIELSAGQAGVRYFRIRVTGVGKQALRVAARGAAVSDIVERRIEVVPDGIERVVTVQDRLRTAAAAHGLDLPAMIIPGTTDITLKVYPAPAAHVIEGLDALLRMPYGCFEQTSSTTYPNALILQYLRRARKNTPEIERRALTYLQTGYQKLLSFEVRGGGFSWFGNAPAHKVLTAYGLEEFADMAEVYPVDPRVIERTQRFLSGQQEKDGSFAPDQGGIREGAIDAVADDRLRSTAFIALALQRTDPQHKHQSSVEHAKSYVRSKFAEKPTTDPYTLALVTELLGGGWAPASQSGAAGGSLVERLWATRKLAADGRTPYFTPATTTPTHGGGKSGQVETTALSASAFLRSAASGRAAAALDYLITAKDSFGTWYSTQATIRALKAMIQQDLASQKPAVGRLQVLIDGRPQQEIALTAENEAMQLIAIPAQPSGHHEVALRFTGKGTLDYQLVTRYYLPRTAASTDAASLPAAPLEITTAIDSTEVKRGEILSQTATLSATAQAMMPLAMVGIPPGFSVEREPLDRLVAQKQIEKYELTPRHVVVYLNELKRDQRRELTLELVANLPGRVQIPAASIYPYYEPELRRSAAPLRVEVKE